MVFSPDGRLLAAGGQDQIVYVWDESPASWWLPQRTPGQRGIVGLLAGWPASGFGQSRHDRPNLGRERPGQATAPLRFAVPQKELDELWSDLAGEDAAKAYQAILTLQSVPEQAVPLLTERLRLNTTNDKRIARLLAQLDHDDFARANRRPRSCVRLAGMPNQP